MTDMLGQAIATSNIAHAYLFAGPRGTGKTSVARILAKAVNCLQQDSVKELPCNECAHCLEINKGQFLDVVEIDAASHNKVEDVRELIEQVYSVPSAGKYKVYILDEVHMLSSAAFNALLKTMEEPPAHVIFVLCTTESHKVPVTIASRCQRFVFSGARESEVRQLLTSIAKAEDFSIDDEAIAVLAQLADGGFRDAVMLLEQVMSSASKTSSKSTVSRADIEEQLGLANQQTVQRLAEAIVQKNIETAVAVVEEFVANGGEVRFLANRLMTALRLLLLTALKVSESVVDADEQAKQWLKTQAAAVDIAMVTKVLQNLAANDQRNATVHPALAVELAIIEGMSAATQPTNSQPIAPARVARQASLSAGQHTPTSKMVEKVDSEAGSVSSQTAEVSTEQNEAESQEESAPIEPSADVADGWQRVLALVLEQNRSVGALLRHHCAPVSLDGSVLYLHFWNSFHKKQVEVDKNRMLVEKFAAEVFGQPVKLRGELVDKSLKPKKQPMTEEDVHNVAPIQEDSELVDAALEMFGGELVD